MNEIRTENWRGYNIRFVNIEGEWWAILKDICDALRLKTYHVSSRLDSDMMLRVQVPSDIGSNDNRSKGVCDNYWMLAINECGVYEALFNSRKLEARQFRKWVMTVLCELRKVAKLEGYQVMQMTDKKTQDFIDDWLELNLFFDEETGKWMEAYTVPGGDVAFREYKK